MKKARRFCEAVQSNPRTQAFRVLNSQDEPEDWLLEPIRRAYLSEDDGEGLYIVRAIQTLSDGSLIPCFLDIRLPDRISDNAYFVQGNTHYSDQSYLLAGHIIPCTAIDCFGFYGLFHNPLLPQLGLIVLKEGLKLARRKRFVAEDLGYLLRDLGRYEEAIEMFALSAQEDPSSPSIFHELSYANRKIGNHEQADYYAAIHQMIEKLSWRHPNRSSKQIVEEVLTRMQKAKQSRKKSPR